MSSQTWHIDFYRLCKAMIKLLARMENLVDLELPTQYFDEIGYQHMAFRSLKYLHYVALRTICYMSDDACVSVDVGLTKRFAVPASRSQVFYRCESLRESGSCMFCSEFFRMSWQSANMLEHAATHSHRRWGEEVQQKLKLRQPAQATHQPYVLSLTLRDGTRQEVNVWGLPVDTPEIRARRKRKTVYAERRKVQSLQPTIRSSPIPVKCVDDEEDEIQIPFGRRMKHWRYRTERAKRDHEPSVQRRIETRQVEAQYEAARQRSARKKATKERKKAESQAVVERKAANKRSGKRNFSMIQGYDFAVTRLGASQES